MPKQIIVSHSELDTFRQCPLKHFLGYKQRWTKDKGEGSALGKGSAWHEIMEAHHKVIQHHQDDTGWALDPGRHEKKVLAKARLAVAPLLFDAKTGTQSEVQVLMEWMYEGYVEKYGADREWKTLAVEVPFMVPLPWPNGKDSHYLYKGKIDRIMKSRNDGDLWIEDHKSGGNAPTDFELQLDDQFGSYTWAVRKLGFEVVGSIHSYCRTTRNLGDWPEPPPGKKPQTLDQRFKRYYLNRTDRELDALANDLFATVRNAYPPKSQQLPLHSSPDVRQCGWKCDFKEAHLMMREGISIKSAMVGEGFHQDFTRH